NLPAALGPGPGLDRDHLHGNRPGRRAAVLLRRHRDQLTGQGKRILGRGVRRRPLIVLLAALPAPPAYDGSRPVEGGARAWPRSSSRSTSSPSASDSLAPPSPRSLPTRA